MAPTPVLSILRRDLVRFARSPIRTALMFSIPLAMAAIFALVFGGSSGEPTITLQVLLFNEDEGPLGRLLQGLGQQQPADAGARLEVIPVGAEGYAMIEKGDASALVHVPATFSEDFLVGRPVTLEVVKNPSQAFLPQVVEEGVGLGAVILSEASRMFRDELATFHDLLARDEVPPSAEVAVLAAGFNDRLAQLERYLLPPVLTLESATAEPTGEAAVNPTSGDSVSILSLFLPGLSVMGILFLAQAATGDILQERESGLLRHLLAAPVSVADYLTGKCLSVVLVSALGFAVLVAVGLAVGVTWGSPVAVVVLVATTALAAAGTLLLLTSLARTGRQADAVTTIVIIVWSMVGGTFLPISQIPSFLLPISRCSLTYWATDGFLELTLRGGTLADVVPNAAVLAGCGTLLVAIGVWRLHRQISAGVR